MTFEPNCQKYFLHILEIATGEEVLHREVDVFATVSFSPQGSFAAYTVGGGSGTAIVRDLLAPRERFTPYAVQEPFAGSPLVFSPDGRLLAANCSKANGQISIWDTALGKEVTSISNLPANVYKIAFDATSNRLTVICCDRRDYARPAGNGNGREKPIAAIWITTYDSSTGRKLSQEEKRVGCFHLVSAAAPVGPSHLFLLRETAEERVMLDDVTTGQERGELIHASSENRRRRGSWTNYPGMFEEETTPAGDILAIATHPEPNPFWQFVEEWLPRVNPSVRNSRRTMVLYDTATAKVICELSRADDFIFSSDGKYAATYCAADSTVRIWEIPPRKPVGWFLTLAGVLLLLTLGGFWWQARRRKRQAALATEAIPCGR
jgi:WD40 repeat protein